MYAFEGGSGGLRWKHEGTDFKTDVGQLQDETTPQHDHRLDAEHLAARHHGEASCRDFRESVLAALPHGYMSTHSLASHLVLQYSVTWTHVPTLIVCWG